MISQLFSLQVQKRSANFCFLQGKRQHSCSNRQTYHEVHCNFCCLIKSSQACNTIPKVQDHYSREDVTTVKVIALRVGFLRRRPGIKKHTSLLPSSKSSKKKRKKKKKIRHHYIQQRRVRQYVRTECTILRLEKNLSGNHRSQIQRSKMENVVME